MRSSTPAMFQPPAKSYRDEWIPVLSAKEKAEVLAGENIVFRINYLYDNARAKRHIDAQVTLQTLYNMGAELINSGKAYSADVETPTHESPSEMPKRTKNETKIKDTLMAQYDALPKYTVRNGRHSAPDPFHALFVIRVALDHLSPESIYLMFTSLKIHSKQMTLHPNVIQFPNGSGFLGDYAAIQILRGYILNHHQHYFKFIDNDELEAAVNNAGIFSSSYMCIANEDGNEQVDHILGGSVFRPVKQLTPQLKM